MSRPGSSARPLSSLIAERLASEFRDSGRTQHDVGAASDVSQSQLSKYLRDARVPDIDVLDSMCSALGLDIAEVVAEAVARRRRE